MSHWTQQGEALWERLNTFYADDHRQLKMVEFLIYNLKDLKIKYLVFFEQYSGAWGDLGSRNFSRDFMNFAEEILVRIKIEEDYLLPMLEKLPPESEEKKDSEQW